MKKERPCELNQKLKRLRTSRDALKQNNHKKNLLNKALRDRNVEITDSRDQWKTRSQELNCQKEELTQQIQVVQMELQNAQKKIKAATEETERARMRVDEERERANRLQAELEIIRGKKSRA